MSEAETIARASDALDANTVARFWQQVDQRSHDECWPWTGSISPQGYGRFGKHRAHRFSVWISGRSTPKPLVCDHICRNRRCVNPHHLRVVTVKQNSLENSGSVTAINAAKTHCKYGHELVGSNVRVYRGMRRCHICQNSMVQKYRRRLKAILTEPAPGGGS